MENLKFIKWVTTLEEIGNVENDLNRYSITYYNENGEKQVQYGVLDVSMENALAQHYNHELKLSGYIK